MTGPFTGLENGIESCTAIDGGPRVRQTLRMRRQWPALCLAGAPAGVGGDITYRRAPSGALERAS